MRDGPPGLESYAGGRPAKRRSSNNRKQKEVYNLAHVRVTILVAEERSKPEGDRRTTSQVIAQVVAEFELRGLRVTLACPVDGRR